MKNIQLKFFVMICLSLFAVVACSSEDRLELEEEQGRSLYVFSEGAVTPYGCSSSLEVDLEDGIFTYERFPKESCEGYTEEETPQEYEMCAECDETLSIRLSVAELAEIEDLIALASLEDHDDVEYSGDFSDVCVGAYDLEITFQTGDGITNTFSVSSAICDLSTVDPQVSDLLSYVYGLDDV